MKVLKVGGISLFDDDIQQMEKIAQYILTHGKEEHYQDNKWELSPIKDARIVFSTEEETPTLGRL